MRLAEHYGVTTLRCQIDSCALIVDVDHSDIRRHIERCSLEGIDIHRSNEAHPVVANSIHIIDPINYWLNCHAHREHAVRKHSAEPNLCSDVVAIVNLVQIAGSASVTNQRTPRDLELPLRNNFTNRQAPHTEPLTSKVHSAATTSSPSTPLTLVCSAIVVFPAIVLMLVTVRVATSSSPATIGRLERNR